MRSADGVWDKRQVVADLCGTTEDVLAQFSEVVAGLDAQNFFRRQGLNHRGVLVRGAKLQSTIVPTKHIAATVRGE
jgi:hypothetical protein